MSEEGTKEEVAFLINKMESCTTSDSDCQNDKMFENKKKLDTRNKMHSRQAVNLQERIIFIIDATSEPNSTPFELGRGDKFPALLMIKRIVEIFVNIKSYINNHHEYALVVLSGGEVRYLQRFSSNKVDFLAHVENIEECDSNLSVFDLGKLFSEIEEIMVKKDMSFVTRAILIYCRSHSVPKFTSPRVSFDNIMKKQRFFLDILYIHEHPSDDNKCDTIYSALNELDVKNCAYIFEVGRNATRIHDHMVKLVAHPLQRPLQRDARYSLQSHLSFFQKDGQSNV